MDLRGLEQWVARGALVFMSARASRVLPARRGSWPMTPSELSCPRGLRAHPGRL